MKGSLHRNDRGVALLIVLLVTALLVALVFEFAYSTRVSLRAAVNFRDSQRAYYLARSGVNVAGRLLAEYKKNGKLQDHLEQREWFNPPFVSGGDTQLLIRWEDESGKINIGPDAYTSSVKWFGNLLEFNGIGQGVVDKIKEEKNNKINLVSELHRFLNEEEYRKVEKDLTVISDGWIDVNTASEVVLKSVLAGKSTTAETISMSRKNGPITSLAGTDIIQKLLYNVTSDHFRVQSRATVGEYTQMVEAVIRRDTAGFTILSWRLIL